LSDLAFALDIKLLLHHTFPPVLIAPKVNSIKIL